MRSEQQSAAASGSRRAFSRGALMPALAFGALVAFVVVAAAGPAAAHEGEEGTEAFQFVRQAIALIVNTPDDHEAIADKINDAIEAPDDHGVDIALVEQAQAALDAEDPHQTRTLLEQSIGAAPHLGAADPVAPGEHVDAEPDEEEESAAEPFLDPLDTSRDLSGSDWAVMGGALALIALGGAGALALRPAKEALK